MKVALRVLHQAYGDVAAVDFGSLAVKALQQRMIDLGHSRRTCNGRIAIIRRAWKWVAANELIPLRPIIACRFPQAFRRAAQTPVRRRRPTC